MPTSPVTCFRQDLIVTYTTNNSAKQYLVKNPTNDCSFEFGNEPERQASLKIYLDSEDGELNADNELFLKLE